MGEAPAEQPTFLAAAANMLGAEFPYRLVVKGNSLRFAVMTTIPVSVRIVGVLESSAQSPAYYTVHLHTDADYAGSILCAVQSHSDNLQGKILPLYMADLLDLNGGGDVPHVFSTFLCCGA